MFEELNNNLTSIEEEVTKLKKAVEHIDNAKSAALAAINASNSMNIEFKEHTQKVTSAVDSILKPHQELIAVTERLTNTIEAIDFPKQLRLIRNLLIAAFTVAVLGTILILILK